LFQPEKDSAFGVNFTVSSLFLRETNLVPGSKLWNLVCVNAERRTPNCGNWVQS